MSLNLINELSDLHKKKIENFIKIYGCEDYIGNDIYLQDWANNNKKLFHLLGGKLIYKKEISITKDYEIIYAEVKQLRYNHSFFDLFEDLCYEYCRKYSEPSHFLSGLMDIKIADLIENKYLCSTFTLDKLKNKKSIKINNGMRLMRAIAKVLDYLDADEVTRKTFEDMRIKHSLIFNDAKLEGNLCLSIHPLDFMTMSDNASGWNSCMSWVDDGCYHTGTIEMMNSNCVICAYLESTSDTMCFDSIRHKGQEEYTWNNKKWRQLIYCTQDILLGGKAYPYRCRILTVEILNMLRILALQNWNIEYDFGIEEYQDMKHIDSYNKILKTKEYRKILPRKHNIVIDTKVMYNDFINDHTTPYWCIRNKVKKNLILNVSGAVPCARCGDHNVVLPYDYDALDWIDKFDVSTYDEYDYNTRYTAPKRLICKDCVDDIQCSFCIAFDDNYNAIHSVATIREIMLLKNNKEEWNINSNQSMQICSKCFSKMFKICPTCGKLFIHRIPDYKHLIIGLHESYDKGISQLERKEIDTINLYAENNYLSNQMLIFVECPECIEKRKGESEEVMIPYSRKETYALQTPMYIYNYRLSEKEFNKYKLDNMIRFNSEDFKDYQKGVSFNELIKKHTIIN